MAAVEKQTKVQERMQDKELAARKDIARIQGNAQVHAASVPLGLGAVNSNQSVRNSKEGHEYDTSVSILRDKAKAEIPKLLANTRLSFSVLRLSVIRLRSVRLRLMLRSCWRFRKRFRMTPGIFVCL